MSKVAEKQKIRDKYRGVSPDELEKIPAIEEKNIFEDDVHMRVAVYARVSTDDPRQTSSFELQMHDGVMPKLSLPYRGLTKYVLPDSTSCNSYCLGTKMLHSAKNLANVFLSHTRWYNS